MQTKGSVAVLCKMTSVGCLVERAILPHFPVWSFSLCTSSYTPSLIIPAIQVCFLCFLCVCVCARICTREPALLCQACQMCSCPPEEARTMRSIRVQLSNGEKRTSDALNVGCCHGNTGCRFSTSLAAIGPQAFLKMISKKYNWKMGGLNQHCPRRKTGDTARHRGVVMKISL